jgi:hypothetical protein
MCPNIASLRSLIVIDPLGVNEDATQNDMVYIPCVFGFIFISANLKFFGVQIIREGVAASIVVIDVERHDVISNLHGFECMAFRLPAFFSMVQFPMYSVILRISPKTSWV